MPKFRAHRGSVATNVFASDARILPLQSDGMTVFLLGWLGTQAASPFYTLLAQVGTAGYFAYFVLMPWYTRVEKTKPVPERVPA